MKETQKLILVKDNQIAIHREKISCYCDFCESSYGEMSFVSSCENATQICENCIIQLNKLIK